jgi:hypothetical protein
MNDIQIFNRIFRKPNVFLRFRLETASLAAICKREKDAAIGILGQRIQMRDTNFFSDNA